ncbi:DinB family protein [Actinokineospora bangkokensis]|uniref:Serine/arginine repetitive matrix protein 1 n=1 Tax=Actinokineospora bangkokensis TaxID=1193682 RepID=A0A1Q9LG37_9PSEU|nr:DinB family protein [Actinokineospora bangkokensis]OLR90983.1 serine/arginine repetitive matrix protein 1 [Actinokineospora bangkokensis]
MRTISWNSELLDQLTWHWDNQLRPRLDGLTDAEYHWEPVPGCWGVRPRTADDQPGTGEFTVDFAFPAPEPAPVTTIAWRIAHVVVGVYGARTAAHFGGPATDYGTHPYAGDAATALRQLDDAHAAWVEGVRSLGEDGLLRPCGPAEGPFAEAPLGTLVLHIHREVIHHGAEVALLRDLHAHR